MANHIGAPLITIPGIRESLKDMIENGAEIQGNAACYFSGLSNAVENSASLTLVPNNSQEGNIKAMTPGIGSENFTFQRNTTATRVNKDGLIEVVDNNIPRLDYLNGNCPEILIEPQRTNLLQFSEDFENNYWSRTLTSNANNQTVSPDGTQNATLTQRTSDNSQSFPTNRRTFNVTSDIYSVSIFVKNFNLENTDIIRLQISNNNFAGTRLASLDFNFDNETLDERIGGQEFEILSSKLIKLKNGWFYISGSIKIIEPNVDVIRFSISTRTLDNQNKFAGYYIWGAQLEIGSSATSYIPTAGTIATRNADIAFINNYSNIFGDKNSRVIELNGQNNIYIDREDFQLPNGRIKLSYEFKDLIKGKELKNLNVNEIKYGERENIKNEYISTIDFNPSLSLIPGKKDIGEITTLIPREGDDFDFQRNTTATYVDKDGLIKTALANEPRFNYKDGEFDGLLIEPQRTNIIEFSNDFTQWNNVSDSVTITPNFEISLDGTQNATKLLNSTTSPRFRIGVNREPNTTYTTSFFAKNLVGNTISWRTAAIQLLGGVEFDLINGTFNFNNVREWNYENVEMQNYGNGWWRCIITYTTTENSLNNDEGFIAGSGSFENENLIFGVQLEEGTSATSYIPTAGTIATRNADILSNDILGEINTDVQKSYYFHFTWTGDFILTLSRLFNFRFINPWFRVRIELDTGNTNIILKNENPLNKEYKIVVVINNDTVSYFVNGVKEVDSLVLNPSSNFNIREKVEIINGRIKNISKFDSLLSDEEAINLTTL